MSQTDNDRIKTFEETLRFALHNGRLFNSVKESKESQCVYFEIDDPMEKGAPRNWLSTRVELVPKKTFEAAKDYAQTRVAVLNFADWITPGGRVWEGSRAQEECLCRVSTLYQCISDDRIKSEFYQRHTENYIPNLYNDDIVYTKGVVVFREDDAPNHFMSYDDWFKCDVITCAAPNNTWGNISEAVQYDIFLKRFKWIIEVASTNKVDTLVLGAFGCGAFHNDPTTVARACYNAVTEMAGKIGRIVIAIPYVGKGDSPTEHTYSENYDAFAKWFDRTYFEAKE